jgi:transcriptional regulator with XRE-family HTH domain
VANDTPIKVRDDVQLNELIRLARLAAGLTRPEVAQRAGLSTRTYERIEDGSREPLDDELVAIAQITGQELELFRNASSSGAAEAGTVKRQRRQVKDEAA